MLVIFVWVLTLHFISYAQQVNSIDEGRLKSLSEIEEISLADLLSYPPIKLEPIYSNLSAIPRALRSESEYDVVKNLYEAYREEPAQGYLEVSRYLKSNTGTLFKDWLSFLQADYLLKSQLEKEDPQLSFPLEEYLLNIRLYPQHPENDRVIYQIAYIQLQSGLYPEVQQTVERGLAEHSKSKYVPLFHLLRGEQFFRLKKSADALSEFSLIVRKYPRSLSAVEAAFRRAYILFQEKKFDAALATYRNLSRFHSDVFDYLNMKKDPSSSNKLLDRIYFAETLYLTGNFSEASEMFQYLANLFSDEPLAAFMWIRFADTFFARSKPQAALRIYEYIRKRKKLDPKARALASLRVADTLFMAKAIEAQTENPRLYKEAYELAKEADSENLASLALVKKALFYITYETFPKAKTTLQKHRDEFSESRNIDWVAKRYVQVLEIEIYDHYQAEDYLAALTAYLVNESDSELKFDNVEVLLRLSDAARSLSLLGKSKEILNRVIYLESSSEARQEALLKLIQILIEQGDLKTASERLRRFNFAYPRTKLKYLYDKAWGDLYVQLDNWPRAISHYEESLNAARFRKNGVIDVRHTLVKLGELYAKQKLPIKAIKSYKDFLRLYEDEEKIKLEGIPLTSMDAHYLKVARYRIADLYFDMKDYVQALSAYTKVAKQIKEEPFYSHTQYRIGECYLALNDRQSALSAFAQVKSEDQQNIWLRAAQSYIKSVELEVENGIRIFN